MADLLRLLLRVAEKAANVARVCRQEAPLFQLLVQEKTGDDKNKKFVQDFKTLADVVIQEMIRHDVGAKFPEMAGFINGEESNKFENGLGESVIVTVCGTEEETAALLATVLDGDHTAASLLARAIHQDPVTIDASTDGLTVPLSPSELGIWIDPIDATSQYIEGKEEVLEEGHLSPSGLHCALVLIGVYLRSTGEPVMGVINQPFNYKDPAGGGFAPRERTCDIGGLERHLCVITAVPSLHIRLPDLKKSCAMSLPRTLGELQLYRVLQRANLLAYYETFIQQGGDDVQQLCEAAEEEFLEIMALVGMATKPLHVRRLQKALRDWAANPALFSQPVSNVPLGGIPLFKVDGTGTGGSAGGPRKSMSNGQPGSPCEREDRACLTPMHSGSPRSPCSQASPQPPDAHYREKLSPMDPHWLSPEPDGNCTLTSASGIEEEPPSPPLLSTCPPGPSTSPSSSASFAPAALSAWPTGQLDGETARAVVESVDRLLRTLPRSDPAEVKTLLRMNKKMAKTVGHIFKMGSQDVNKEEEIRKYSLIYGRFDSKRREGKQLTHHELIINEAAAQFCMRDNALLLRRVELFSLARQVARKCAYTSTLKHARSNADENSVLSQKRPRHEVIVPESVSSLLGVEGSESLTQRADDDSLSAESLDSVSHDIGSQCNQSPSPRPHTDTSNPASWSRHLIQQTLMDEGLRLARMVSHDRAGKISLGSERTHSSDHDSKVERRSSITACRSSSHCITKDDSNHRGK